MPETAGSETPALAGEAQAAGGDKPIILVIDDSRVIRRAISKVLSGEFMLIEAEDGEVGWQQLVADDRIQVIITDVEMPNLDGYSLICRIRASETQRLRDIPIIVITGAQDDQTRERAFACGATDFVIKPLDGVQLLARARAHARLDETIRQLSETTKTLEDQTAIDPLTELHSRRYLLQRGTQDLAFAKRHGQDLGVIRVDFDNFRELYKQYGDDICDQMFIWLAGIMRTNVRTEDTAARIRGGQFAILTPGAERAAATVLCERLRAAVEQGPFVHEDKSIAVTISLGLATLNNDQLDTIEDLLALAEQRLTLAKAAGGNQLSVGYEEAVQAPEEAIMEQPDLETALRMIAEGDGGKLTPYLPEMTGRILPLLELCDNQLDLNLAAALQTLRERLGIVK